MICVNATFELYICDVKNKNAIQGGLECFDVDLL